MPKALTKPRLALLRVAKKALALEEEPYREILERFGGSPSARDLDERGFDAVMDRFHALGFVSTARKRSYGKRAGMATPDQVDLVRALWSEVGGGDEAHLNAWLTKVHKVSALRFATAAKVGQIIAALKEWKARERRKAHVD